MKHNLFTVRKGVAASCALLLSMGLSSVNATELALASGQSASIQKSSVYIVKLKDASSVQHARELSSVAPKMGLKVADFQYDANSPANSQYAIELINKQRSVIKATGIERPIYSYAHTFNGFAVKLTSGQVKQLNSHPDVAAVYPDERLSLTSINTPDYLGLSGEAGLHTSLTGEDVIVGVVDSGLNFEHPSFADDGSYSDPATLGWKGSCNSAGDETVVCSNKVIGAYHFNASAIAANPGLAFKYGEYQSPRDKNGHGTHVAGTAAGGAVPASVNHVDAGVAMGMAPRARIAVYKACWGFADTDKSGCYGGDTMAAIEQATKDGVDVINFSLSGSRTSLITAASQAFLSAADAGIFVATSAGNDGPTEETVGKPVPWVTNVAAASHDGATPLPGIEVTGGFIDGKTVQASWPVDGFGPSLDQIGEISSELVAALPVDACESLTNADAVAGKIAYIRRGECSYPAKIRAAEDAGAIAVLFYNDRYGEGPVLFGGLGLPQIPSMMIGSSDGKLIELSLKYGREVSVKLSPQIRSFREFYGNTIADFSSRGPSQAVVDLIVPDITAPGVNILAASPTGEEFQYMSGTSMASPHIAGIAALMKQAHPDWSPAAIRSALMTTSRQGLVKEDGITPADPFDAGSGYVVPVSAIDPGLIYDADLADYVGFVCGKADEVEAIESTYGEGICQELESKGYRGGSAYNNPSIGISELSKERRVVRYVTNVTQSASTYRASIELPESISVSLSVYDEATGHFVPADSMTIAPGQKAAYALDFDKTESSVLHEWVFGHISWSDGVHTVYSPIAIKPVETVYLEVPDQVSSDAVRSLHRVVIPMKPDYTGQLLSKAYGLAEAEQITNMVYQDEDQEFKLNDPGAGKHEVKIFPGTKAIKFALYTDDLEDSAVDLDLVVYSCPQSRCSIIGQSGSDSSDEVVILSNPAPLYEQFDKYLVFVHGWSLNGAESVEYTLNVTTLDETSSGMGNMLLRHSPIARKGVVSNSYFFMRGLEKGKHYFGGASFSNDEGKEIGFTALSVDYP